MPAPALCSAPGNTRRRRKPVRRSWSAPGATPALLAAATVSFVPFLPGVATAGEAMTLADAGYKFLKFFPTEPAGGIAYLKALSAPPRAFVSARPAEYL